MADAACDGAMVEAMLVADGGRSTAWNLCIPRLAQGCCCIGEVVASALAAGSLLDTRSEHGEHRGRRPGALAAA